jgi:saccharopine dehydrogenase-like NADP-dependent oxidoreductase
MRVLVLGANGKVGGLVTTLLIRAGFKVIAADQQSAHTNADLRAEYHQLDKLGNVALSPRNENLISMADIVIPMLPASIIPPVAITAHKLGKHYIDPTEVVSTTDMIRKLPENGTYMVPQSGLAPGFIGVVGGHLASKFNKGEIEEIKLMVGALPQDPVGVLKWASSWSVEGMITECLEHCDVVINGKAVKVAALDGREDITVFGEKLEAAYTSGGLGTLAETYPVYGNAAYKTLRYEGHWRNLRKMLKLIELGRLDIPTLARRLNERHPATEYDRVVVMAEVQGNNNGVPFAPRFEADFLPIEIEGKSRTAIAWTTAAGIVAVAELARDKKLIKDKNSNFVRQELIPLSEFLATEAGDYYASQSKALERISSIGKIRKRQA